MKQPLHLAQVQVSRRGQHEIASPSLATTHVSLFICQYDPAGCGVSQ